MVPAQEKKMKTVPLVLTAMLAGVSLGALTLQGASAVESAPNSTTPGFVPDTGQINPGTPRHHDPQTPETQTKIPSAVEAYAAFHAPTPKGPAIGNMPATTLPAQSTNPAQSVNAIGGPMAPGASSSGVAGGTAHGQAQSGSSASANSPGDGATADRGQTTGKASQESGPGTAAAASSGMAPADWPVGSVAQTAPAKFSQRNDTLDRVPMRGWFTLPLNDEQREKIFSAVMADQGAPSPGADKLAISTQVTTQQALNEMKPLPQSIGIDHVRSLDYLKAKDKVFLVEPATRVVVGVLTK
jgi:hypothetical protein